MVKKEGGMTCCGGLEKIQELADLPFYRPVILEDGQLALGGWAIKLFKKTKAGKVSTKSPGSVFIAYCPLCGACLVDVPRTGEAQT